MDIIVVLGSSLIKGKLSEENIGRLNLSLEIFKYKNNQNSNVIFIVSGSKIEAEAMYEYLKSKDVSPGIIIMEKSSKNTIENIINSSSIIKEILAHGETINSITYVSSDYHIPRIVKILQYFGVEGIELFASGSKVYPKSRETREKQILRYIDQSIMSYR